MPSLPRSLLVVALGAGCHRGRADDGSLLDRIPAEADVVVMVRPSELADTWAAALAGALARRADLPDCVVSAAGKAPRVVIAWGHQLPEDGWIVALAGAGDPACPALVVRGAVATWSRGLEIRSGDEPGFFDDRARRARWSTLPDRAVRGLAEHELSAGIVAHAELSLDPRDGVHATARVRFDSPDAAAGVRARLERWRGDLDRERMGGAWPAIAALDVEGPGRGDASLALQLDLAGELGATAAPLLATALAVGADRSDRAPCPLASVSEPWKIGCQGGEVRVPIAVRDALVTDAEVRFAADRYTTTMSAGQLTGLRLTAVGAASPLLALGLREGDWLQTVDAVAITSPIQLAAIARATTDGTVVTVALTRAGRARTLRFKLVARPGAE